MITYPLNSEMEKEVITALNSKMDRTSIPADVKKSALLYTIQKNAPALTQDILNNGWTNGNFKVYSPDGMLETSPLKIAAESYRDNPIMENSLIVQTLLRFKVKQNDMEEIVNIISSAKTNTPDAEVIKNITLGMIEFQNVDVNDVVNFDGSTNKKVYDSSFTDNMNPDEFVEKQKQKQKQEERTEEKQNNTQNKKEEKPKMQAEAASNSNNYDIPADYFRSNLDKIVKERSKTFFSKLKKLEEPKWILQQNEDAKEFWARLQLSTINTGSFLETTGFSGVLGLMTAYGVMGVAPMFTPQAYALLHNFNGWTNIIQPDSVTYAPIAGIAIMLLGIPSKVMGFLSRTNDNRKQQEMNKIIEDAIEKNLIDPQRFMEELRLKGGFKRSFFEKFLNKETQEHKIDRYVHNAIKNYNKTARAKINTDLPPGTEIEDNKLGFGTAKELAESLKNKIMKDSQENKSNLKP